MIDAKAMSLVLTAPELEELTRYKRPGEQLAELQRRGFHRARKARDGSVVLERAHFEAVCAGAVLATREPRVRD